MLTPDEPRPVLLMNTVWANRSQVHDDLTTVGGLREFLGVPADQADLEAFRALRQALRDLAAVLTEDTRPIAQDRDLERAVAEVNRAARTAPRWPQLAVNDGKLLRRNESEGSLADRERALIAAEAVDLFTGEDAVLVRACHAPGCVLYFVKDHPRREWCSPSCGNRVRAARHYRRNRG
ncbi:ABATE domain-containing protein [Lentzea sp. HUAS12]|uniref:CGNR zinc finger domain-containing protein n=1 Tax=Lentzea sp. HUAS12 TaxID=2951806 RepID=UPI00209ECE5F|nr:ABATE domain-containing protein [Lentzea sp. HUAS12]USX52657.1 ABATE domain-containing protein [Lentzea sp. HUAS12]